MIRKSMTKAWFLVLSWFLVACDTGSPANNDTDTGTDADADTDTDTDSDADSDTDSDTDTDSDADTNGNTDADTETFTDTDPPMTDCDGGKLDPLTGLCWQDPPPATLFMWQQAMSYCGNLTIAGHSDWRVPSISELRSLIRGCPNTEADGPCGVTDDCVELTCIDEYCMQCPSLAGPAPGGCYFDPSLGGGCIYDSYVWSSSVRPQSWPLEDDIWGAGFRNASLALLYPGDTYYVRCVRDGE